MWISKKALADLSGALIARYERALAELDARCTEREYVIDTLREQVAALQRAAVDTEAAKRAALTRADMLTVQYNLLSAERAEFLAKLLDPERTVSVPVASMGGPALTMPSGVSFDDMGDAAAGVHGMADEIPEELTGLSGQVYDPASELGINATGTPPTPPDM